MNWSKTGPDTLENAAKPELTGLKCEVGLSDIRVMRCDYLPPGTMAVSPDIYDAMKANTVTEDEDDPGIAVPGPMEPADSPRGSD